MRPGVQEVLDSISKALRELPQAAAQDIWDILTALRGPDDEDEEVKQATTAVIRNAALGYLSVQRMGAVYNLEDVVRLSGEGRFGHFASHVRRAAAALDLEVVEVEAVEEESE